MWHVHLVCHVPCMGVLHWSALLLSADTMVVGSCGYEHPQVCLSGHTHSWIDD